MAHVGGKGEFWLQFLLIQWLEENVLESDGLDLIPPKSHFVSKRCPEKDAIAYYRVGWIHL